MFVMFIGHWRTKKVRFLEKKLQNDKFAKRKKAELNICKAEKLGPQSISTGFSYWEHFKLPLLWIPNPAVSIYLDSILLKCWIMDHLSKHLFELKGHNLLHFAHTPCCYLDFKLCYLEKHETVSNTVTESFEHIVLRKKRQRVFAFLKGTFLKNTSVCN